MSLTDRTDTGIIGIYAIKFGWFFLQCRDYSYKFCVWKRGGIMKKRRALMKLGQDTFFSEHEN